MKLQCRVEEKCLPSPPHCQSSFDKRAAGTAASRGSQSGSHMSPRASPSRSREKSVNTAILLSSSKHKEVECPYLPRGASAPWGAGRRQTLGVRPQVCTHVGTGSCADVEHLATRTICRQKQTPALSLMDVLNVLNFTVKTNECVCVYLAGNCWCYRQCAAQEAQHKEPRWALAPAAPSCSSLPARHHRRCCIRSRATTRSTNIQLEKQEKGKSQRKKWGKKHI